MNHTKGPWELDDELAVYGWGENGGQVWIASHKSANDADAFLIAAAPDLLAALENFVMRYTMLVNSGDAGNWDPEDDAVVIQARFAIAKAKGEA